MTADSARKWLIISSLLITGAQLIFLIIAPSIGVPLEYPKNLDLLQIVMPVFLGYLGSATHFIFLTPTPIVETNNQFLGLLVKGPITIYSIAVIAAFCAFSYSNRIDAPIGTGMSVANLGTALSIALGLLAVTTGIIVSYLFVASRMTAAHPESVGISKSIQQEKSTVGPAGGTVSRSTENDLK